MELGGLAAVAGGAAIAYMAYDTYFNAGLEPVISRVDGNSYTVRALPDKEDAADLLANIGAKLTLLMRHLEKTAPDDARGKRFSERFKPDRISEGPENSKYTSYSINKGEKIVFCLRSRDGKNELVDLNTMMFVALHEVAHICTIEVGHPPSFWENFKWLLTLSLNIGIYQDQDFKRAPQAYCGITITDSPLHGK
jgi:hypothetical protein